VRSESKRKNKAKGEGAWSWSRSRFNETFIIFLITFQRGRTGIPTSLTEPIYTGLSAIAEECIITVCTIITPCSLYTRIRIFVTHKIVLFTGVPGG
jgi:hypothetical protein